MGDHFLIPYQSHPCPWVVLLNISDRVGDQIPWQSKNNNDAQVLSTLDLRFNDTLQIVVLFTSSLVLV